jgi:zinc protease
MSVKSSTVWRRVLVGVVLAFVSTAVLATPKIEHWTLKNGARVYFVESRDLPMVALNVVFDAGSARDPLGRNGLSMLADRLLNQGTKKLNANQIAERFEGLGAEFDAGSDRDMASVSLRSLSDRRLLDPALAVLAQLIAEPAYPPESLERERARAVLGLKQATESPDDVASKAFFAQLYKGHPYALPPEGSESGLKAITRDDLVDFHARYYVGRNVVFALIGDVSRHQAQEIAERVVGRLPAGEAPPPLPKVPDVVPPGSAERVIAHPSTQSHILIGEVGMRRNDPDFYPLYLGNFILGGSGLVARLSQEVREKRGLSYSVYSYFIPLREPGPFMLGLQTKNSQRGEALAVVRRTLADFTAKGPTPEELVAAKKNISGGFPLRFDSNRKIAEYLTVIGFYGLPLTYLDDFIPKIEAVTAEQIRDAFRRRVHPEHMVTVIVGGSGH